MIKTFKDVETRRIFQRQRSSKFPGEIQKRAYRKLVMIHKSINLKDLRTPPGNRLEKLSGDRAGQWSIRINDQWRICFEWHDEDAYDVEITDYH
ncbi:MAG: type II toxin-antitoxin system RelE/ParE family toxin [Anaerolineales bacterium]|nr:type II toxin-antitoxin system RelE/ParE family toxin [Anaerolineales bacterium]